MRFDKERFRTPNPLARAIILTADKFEDCELFVPSHLALAMTAEYHSAAQPIGMQL
jgi:hypothetical protein